MTSTIAELLLLFFSVCLTNIVLGYIVYAVAEFVGHPVSVDASLVIAIVPSWCLAFKFNE